MSWQTVKISDFLKRSKIPVDIEDSEEYKRVTIRGKHQGVSLRDIERGKNIGTKKQFFLKEGQFILSKIDARYGAFGIAPPEVDDAIITGNFWAYDVDKEKVNIEWFNQYTNSPIFYDLCERASSGITHRKYLDEGFFLNYEIDLPSIDEQETIIGIINIQKASMNEVSTELNRQLVLVKQLRQAYLREAMEGKLVAQDDTDEPAEVLLKKIKAKKEKLAAEKRIKRDKPLLQIEPEEIPFEIHENSIFCRLGEITFIEKGNLGIMKAVEGEYPLVSLAEERAFHNEFQFDCKAVIVPLVSLTGHGHASIKRIHYQEGKFAVGSILCAIVPISYNFLNARFLFEYLNTFKEEFFVSKMRGAANVSLSVSAISSTPIPIIPICAQEKFEKLMKFCDELEANIRQGITNADQLLQTALKEALEPKEFQITS